MVPHLFLHHPYSYFRDAPLLPIQCHPVGAFTPSPFVLTEFEMVDALCTTDAGLHQPKIPECRDGKGVNKQAIKGRHFGEAQFMSAGWQFITY